MELHLFDQFVLDGVGDLGWRFHDDVFYDPKGNLTNVTSLLYAVPPVTALLDYIIFKNQLSFMAGLGMVFIIAGLFLINRQGKII